MAKLKTKKGVAKRFKLTKKGKIKYSAGGKSHLLSHKHPSRIRSLRRRRVIRGKKDVKYLKRMLPYG
jgi:large subunit ribosomal protein L35